MTNKITKPKVISSLFWKLMEQGGTQLVTLLVQIVLARLLDPDNFGTIAIVLAFINVAKVLIQGGLNTALIQKKNADDLDFSTVFYASLLISAVLYLLLFLTAPTVSSYYRDPKLIGILRIIALTLFPGALNSVQYAYISKNLLYKKLFYNSFAAAALSGVVGIVAAFAGLGVWALVIQNLISQISVSAIMWFTVKWRPKLQFSFDRLKTLFSFGGKLLVSNLLDSAYTELRTLIIGRKHSAAELGYFNRGQSMPNLLAKMLDGSIQSVMLPTMSKLQDDRESLKRVVRRSVKTSSFLVFPVMFGFAAIAEPAITVILGEKWLPAVPFLQILSAASAMRPIHSANLQAINALGRSDIYLRLAIIKNIMGLAVLFASVPFGIYAIAIGQIVYAILSALINAWPNKNLFGYSAKEQLVDILPALSLSILMGVLVYLISLAKIPALLMMVIQIAAGATIYLLLARLFRLESMSYIGNTVKEIFSKRKKKAE